MIVHIGPARAAQIVSLRPFSSVDDLIRVKGIGPQRLAGIKAQGIACVNG
jgi:DNA uptake protein ComE-like DNA-binding protein